MRSNSSLLTFCILCACAVLALPTSAVYAGNDESVYERVMRTGKIRCGYVIYNPVVMQDLENGGMRGILVDIMAEIGERLELEVEWAEEIPFTTRFEGLKTGRYDMVCTAAWGWPNQARVAELIGPLYFYPLGIWVRSDDARFDSDWSKINSPEVTISGVDGTFPLNAARDEFPEAKVLALPQTAEYSQPLLDVVTGKADVTFIDNNMGMQFIENNPDSLKNIAVDPPFRIFGNYLMVNKGEHSLGSMVRSVIDLMLLDGSIDRIIRKYETDKGGYYRVDRPYTVRGFN